MKLWGQGGLAKINGDGVGWEKLCTWGQFILMYRSVLDCTEFADAVYLGEVSLRGKADIGGRCKQQV